MYFSCCSVDGNKDCTDCRKIPEGDRSLQPDATEALTTTPSEGEETELSQLEINATVFVFILKERMEKPNRCGSENRPVKKKKVIDRRFAHGPDQNNGEKEQPGAILH